MYTINLKAPDIPKQLTKLANFDRVYKKHVKPAMEEVATLSQLGMKSVAAVKTGYYRDSIQKEVRMLSSATVARAFTTVRSGRGFPYPRALEDSTRYHYRSTSRRGQQTAGQVWRMFQKLKNPAEVRVHRAGERIIAELVVK